ncbi:MAG: hypothetical protein R2773_04945 [Flavobacteriaceae bacterium]
MHRLSFAIILFGILSLQAQSPHGNGLKIDCAQCHNPNGWSIDMDNIQFDHSNTNFELDGTHTTTDCKLCHTSLVFTEVKTDCIGCHLDVHGMTVGNDCMRCHDTNSWLVDNIPELHEENGFPLIGSHSVLNCVDCHLSESSLRFDRIGNECISCHLNDYLTTQNPNHQTNGFSQDCLECHNPFDTDWDSNTINHDFFPLTLGHDIQDCSQCHNVNNFSDISPECVSCHMEDFLATVNPDHEAANFSMDCIQCHTTNPGWSPAIFPHEFFPLTLGHDIEDCTACHINGNYTNTPNDCFACHQNDYIATTNPDHETANFPTDCVVCHTTNPGWSPAVLNHDFFPLTLGHDIEDCTACHINNNYNNTPTDCFACHENDYSATTNPDHEAANFPTDCTACHSTNPGWSPAILDHSFFPLTLGHDIEDCTACHINGNYNNTPTDCFACHENDYANANDPNHEAANFPTDCVVCHTTNPGWSPANFDHDGMYFPIYSGSHENAWNNCIDCHTNVNDYSIFTCITCHTKNETANQHDPDEVPDYVYESSACFACHPNG